VYIQQGENFEKRNVKVGVSDYFFAEIQEGLNEGEIVSLELPKEEREKKIQQNVAKRRNKNEGGGTPKLAAGPSGASTNGGGALGASSPETPSKTVPPGTRPNPRDSSSR